MKRFFTFNNNSFLSSKPIKLQIAICTLSLGFLNWNNKEKPKPDETRAEQPSEYQPKHRDFGSNETKVV